MQNVLKCKISIYSKDSKEAMVNFFYIKIGLFKHSESIHMQYAYLKVIWRKKRCPLKNKRGDQNTFFLLTPYLRHLRKFLLRMMKRNGKNGKIVVCWYKKYSCSCKLKVVYPVIHTSPIISAYHIKIGQYVHTLGISYTLHNTFQKANCQ